MPEPFLVAKAVDMSASALGKSTSVVIKGLVVLGIVVAVGWAVFVTYIKPHTNPTPTTSQKAETITNVYEYPSKRVFSAGFTIFGTDIGIVKYDYTNRPIVKQIVTGDNPSTTVTPAPTPTKKHWYFLWLF